MPFQQLDKIGVFGQDDDVCTASCSEDLGIRRTVFRSRTGRQSMESVARIQPASAGGS
jgi:hypothetical protein